jgi:TonB-linked SusC/RagA family outer membrane protein
MKKKLSLLTGMLVLCVQLALAQTVDVSGKVTDDKGNAIVGATVQERGTRSGTTTDENGSFKLSVKKGSSIQISNVGFDAKTVPVGNGGAMNIQLVSAEQSLGEVVVTGVAQATSKKKVSFSLTSVKGSDINIVPQLDASQSLRGRVAGIQINQAQGNQGAAVFLRGAKSVFGNIPPLIVIDGFQTNLTLSELNPEDIESIEVVKGAAASSLYGTRAEGGVIQVITKKGKNSGGKPTIVVDAEYGVNDIQRIPDLATNHIYKTNPDGSFQFSSPNQRIQNIQSNGFSLILSPYKDNFDNTSALLDNRPFSNVVMSISSASGPLKYYLSFQNQVRGGAVKPVDADKRNTLKLNVGYNPWSKVETNVTFQYINFDRPSFFVSNNTQGTLFASTLQYEPFINLLEKNLDGTFKAKPTGFEIQNANLYNPLYEWSQREVTNVVDNLLVGADLRYKFAKGFDFFISGSLNSERGNSTNWYPVGYQTVTPSATLNNGFYGVFAYSDIFKNGNIQINYNTTIKDFEVGASIKAIYEEYRYEGNGASGFKMSSPVKDLSVTDPATRTTNTIYRETVNHGYMVNGRVGYKNKLFLDGLVRMDRSSRYGADVQNALFPRVSAAYRITQDFKLGPVNELKVRAAWGRAGSLPLFNAKNSIVELGATTISLTQLENTKLERSITEEIEVGIDGQLFNRINFNLTYARANSEGDFINPPPVQAINGISGVTKNLGSVKSFSYEAEFNGDIIRKKNFVWNTGLTFTLVRSRIDDLGGIPDFQVADIQNGIAVSAPLFRKAPGLSAYGFWGEVVVRDLNQLQFDKTTGFVNNARLSSGALSNLTINDFAVNSMGFVVVKSALGTSNERPVFMANSATGNNFFLQRGEPDFQIGIPTNLTIKKSINVFFLIDWKQGGYKYNQTLQYLTFDNRTKVSEDFIRAGLPIQFIQQIYNGNSITDYWLEKNSFVALRELSVAYNLNGSKLGSLGKVVKNIRIAAVGRNMFYFTKYQGVNPEGYFEYYPYPVYRTISGKLTFNLF